MAEQSSGIDLMRRRIERASRQPPPAPRPREDRQTAGGRPGGGPAPTREPVGGESVAEATAAPTAAPGPGGGESTTASRRRRPAAPAPVRLRLAPDLPPVNLAIRVRKPLDDHLADLIHALRHDGVRTSKVELIEMLLWEQTGEGADGLRARLAAFRAAAPRGAGAAI